MKRRQFLVSSLTTGAGLAVFGCTKAANSEPKSGATTPKTSGESPMAFEQPALPFPLDGLDPFLSKEQMDYHYNKHHAAYFANLNKLVDGTPQAEMSLEDLVKTSEGGVFNNAAQAWNHSFFWNCMTPNGGGEPGGQLAEAIQRDFGSFSEFRKQFTNAAVTLFGSGWAWLAKTADGKLEITQGSNADTPLRHKATPVLTVDVWEHAYYVDYRNLRAKFVEGFWDTANWQFAEKAFAG